MNRHAKLHAKKPDGLPLKARGRRPTTKSRMTVTSASALASSSAAVVSKVAVTVSTRPVPPIGLVSPAPASRSFSFDSGPLPRLASASRPHSSHGFSTLRLDDLEDMTGVVGAEDVQRERGPAGGDHPALVGGFHTDPLPHARSFSTVGLSLATAPLELDPLYQPQSLPNLASRSASPRHREHYDFGVRDALEPASCPVSAASSPGSDTSDVSHMSSTVHQSEALDLELASSYPSPAFTAFSPQMLSTTLVDLESILANDPLHAGMSSESQRRASVDASTYLHLHCSPQAVHEGGSELKRRNTVAGERMSFMDPWHHQQHHIQFTAHLEQLGHRHPQPQQPHPHLQHLIQASDLQELSDSVSPFDLSSRPETQSTSGPPSTASSTSSLDSTFLHSDPLTPLSPAGAHLAHFPLPGPAALAGASLSLGAESRFSSLSVFPTNTLGLWGAPGEDPLYEAYKRRSEQQLYQQQQPSPQQHYPHITSAAFNGLPSSISAMYIAADPVPTPDYSARQATRAQFVPAWTMNFRGSAVPEV